MTGDSNMQLYAAGFNAWNQLSFGKDQEAKEQPDDYHGFVKISAHDRIDNVWASLTAVRGMCRAHALLSFIAWQLTNLQISRIQQWHACCWMSRRLVRDTK
jgi:hypothetical protein